MVRRSRTGITSSRTSNSSDVNGNDTYESANGGSHLVGTPCRRYRTIALPCAHSLREVDQKLSSLYLDVGSTFNHESDSHSLIDVYDPQPASPVGTADLQQPSVLSHDMGNNDDGHNQSSEENEGLGQDNDRRTVTEADEIKTEPVVFDLQPHPDAPNCKSPTIQDPIRSKYRPHKSLKDLIFETNRSMYNVDSNKIRYKVGLSKNIRSVPSLHPRQ